ncbi:MAG: glycosyltransferase [Bacteroidia bacterium]|nr:glycosyltransferase [Bacteroidia bacterium]
MPELVISHISSGVAETGGYRQEQSLLKALSNFYNSKGWTVTSQTKRAHRFYKGRAHLKLLWHGFVRSNADVNIVIWRMALPAIFRNLFIPTHKILIPVHHYDEREITGFTGRIYFKILLWILSNVKFSNVALVSLSSSWNEYFSRLLKGKNPAFLYPTLLSIHNYAQYRVSQKMNRIYLGQFSSKQHQDIFAVAKKLTDAGFQCYFSTLDKKKEGKFDSYEVKYMSHGEYLEWMAQSKYTICFTGIDEGWNRVAHESILVGTYVIANNAGGLGDLVRESGSLMAGSADEIIRFVLTNKEPELNESFIERYDEKNTSVWLKPITDFLNIEASLSR